MQREIQAPLAIEDFLIENDSPLILQSNNSKFTTSKFMKKILRRESIQQALTKLKYQNKNRAERMVQVVKDLTHALMTLFTPTLVLCSGNGM